MEDSKDLKLIRIFMIVVLFILILASFLDQSISKAVMNQNSLFGTIMQNYGMFPENVVPFLAGQIIFVVGIKGNYSAFVSFLAVLGGLAFSFWHCLHYTFWALHYTYTSIDNVKNGLALGAANNDSGVVAVPFSIELGLTVLIFILGTYLSYKWLAKKSANELKYLLKVSFIAIAVFYTCEAVINSMKVEWGRFRPYEVYIDKVDGAHFTNWWQINGDTGHKSFPSGHAFSGMMAIFFPFFVDRKNTNLQTKLTYVGLFYAFLMAISRVRIGAHFLSDVTVSVTITFLIIFLAFRLNGYNFIEDNDSL